MLGCAFSWFKPFLRLAFRLFGFCSWSNCHLCSCQSFRQTSICVHLSILITLQIFMQNFEYNYTIMYSKHSTVTNRETCCLCYLQGQWIRSQRILTEIILKGLLIISPALPLFKLRRIWRVKVGLMIMPKAHCPPH